MTRTRRMKADKCHARFGMVGARHAADPPDHHPIAVIRMPRPYSRSTQKNTTSDQRPTTNDQRPTTNDQ
jgi:hypothetical protein